MYARGAWDEVRTCMSIVGWSQWGLSGRQTWAVGLCVCFDWLIVFCKIRKDVYLGALLGVLMDLKLMNRFSICLCHDHVLSGPRARSGMRTTTTTDEWMALQTSITCLVYLGSSRSKLRVPPSYSRMYDSTVSAVFRLPVSCGHKARRRTSQCSSATCELSVQYAWLIRCMHRNFGSTANS